MAVGASSMLEAAPGLLLICSAAGVLAGSDPAHRAQLPAGARPPQVTVRALPVLQLLPIRAGAAPDLQRCRSPRRFRSGAPCAAACRSPAPTGDSQSAARAAAAPDPRRSCPRSGTKTGTRTSPGTFPAASGTRAGSDPHRHPRRNLNRDTPQTRKTPKEKTALKSAPNLHFNGMGNIKTHPKPKTQQRAQKRPKTRNGTNKGTFDT